METPIYCRVGDRPVKAIKEEDGLGIYAFNIETEKFVLDMSYLEKIYFGSMDDVEILTKSEFDIYVESLKTQTPGDE